MSEQSKYNMEQWENMNPVEILQDIRKHTNSTQADAAEYRKMAGKAYAASIDRMVEALKEMIGEEISTAILMEEVYGDSPLNYMGEMFQVDADLRKAAAEAGLILDMSKHEGKLEGLAFDLEYLVRRGHGTESGSL